MSLFAQLDHRGARYVLVGGLAVVMHGVDRITADIDLAIDLAPEHARLTVDTLTAAGLKPMLPVDARQFADTATRKLWHEDYGMQVFSFWDPLHTRPSVDLFFENTIPFEELWEQSLRVTYGSTAVRIASIPHLIRLKELAGRPQDIADIARLRELQRRP